MKKANYILFIAFGLLFLNGSYAQEDTAADVTQEIVSDSFQEHFFEALKERAVENYDRAIEKLMLCKNLQPTNVAVDFELGKNYFQLKKYAVAQSYLENAVKVEPENIWYLEALLAVYDARGDMYNTLNVDNQLKIKSLQLRENLAKLYAKFGNYEHALQVLDELDAKHGVTTERKNLRALVLAYQFEENKKKTTREIVIQKDTQNPINQYKTILAKLIEVEDKQALLQVATEALDNFPTQPYFYYAKGLALNSVAQYKEAAEVLEMALDFLIDDVELKNNIYKQLAVSYSSLGDTKKASIYLKKTKSRL